MQEKFFVIFCRSVIGTKFVYWLAPFPIFHQYFMKKFFWLTSIVCLCGFVSSAQQGIDSSTQQVILFDGGDSLFTNFSYVVKDNSKIILQWQSVGSKSDSDNADDYFIIERSEDGNNYETIGAIKKMQDNNQYEVADNSSFTGYSFYRIKYEEESGRYFYSKPLQINMPGNVSVKFYPNPVDKLLIVEMDHNGTLQMLNAFGVIKLNTKLHEGLQVVDVSTLEPGTYILHIVDNDRKRNILQQLVKK